MKHFFLHIVYTLKHILKRCLYTSLLFFIPLYSSAQIRWTTDTLIKDRISMDIASIGDHLYYFSGTYLAGNSMMFSNQMEIHNTKTGTKTTSTIPEGAVRSHRTGVAVVGTKIIFGGGDTRISGISEITTRVDIYDTLSKTWTLTHLSEPKRDHATAVWDGKVYFGAGSTPGNQGISRSRTVEIYDVENDSWLRNLTFVYYGGNLPENGTQRSNLTAQALNNNIIFAGGVSSSPVATVNIYNTSTNSFTEAENQQGITLSQARSHLQSVSYQGKAYFIGGRAQGSTPSDVIDIYDPDTNSWDTMTIPFPPPVPVGHSSPPSYDRNAVTVGCKLFLRYRTTVSYPDSVVIYDFARDIWSVEAIPQARSHTTMVAHQNMVYFAGGMSLEKSGIPFENREISLNLIDIYHLYPVLKVYNEPSELSLFDFGDVLVGQDSCNYLYIENDGDYNLLFKDLKATIAGDHSDDFEVDLSLLPDTLFPAQVVELPITFTPASKGTKNAMLTFYSDDPQSPVYEFSLSGNGDEILSTEDLLNNEVLTVFPNPANDIIRLNLPFDFAQGHYTLMDMQGKAIKSASIKGQKSVIRTSDVPTGSYLLQLTIDEQNLVKKIQIQR